MIFRLLTTCLHFFSLKQGTILIAITHLFSSGFILIIQLLMLAHAMEIRELVAIDKEDALEREALDDVSSRHLTTRIMDEAHRNAISELYWLYCFLMITIIHLFTTMLLLYGAIKDNRLFMAPWMMVMMAKIIYLTLSLVIVHEGGPIVALLGKAHFIERMFIVLIILICIDVWFTVYTTYESLDTKKKGLTHEVHDPKKQPRLIIENTKFRCNASSSRPLDV
ncbi:uncharacterized protein LOC105694975 [Orussus abietinus]|uniref:uncharacterized protein LOC105694975 n=1 Tax=Orussus abietinus TaxID=222816 RepID=UPI00062648B6|nr:uncharacterized protein LOC105694975 [Orussus abietinus]XP_012271595.1 uncharacterized protein LOC105694975 [Orussus abietinus]